MIISNKLNTSVQIHLTGNDTIIVAGNSSVSNLAANSIYGEENVASATISKVIWGVAGNTVAYWEIKRGSTIVLELPAIGNSLDLSGFSLTTNSTSNVVANLVGSTTGFLMLELRKKLVTTIPTS